MAYYVPEVFLSARDTAVRKKNPDKNSCPHGQNRDNQQTSKNKGELQKSTCVKFMVALFSVNIE